MELILFFVTYLFSRWSVFFRCNWMNSKNFNFYLCYFSNVMATNFWSIVLTRSSISRHLKFITKRVVSIFNNLAFLEQFWLQIGNNIPLKTPGNLAVGDFDKNNKKYKKESSNFRLWIYSSASEFLILWTEKRATKNCDKSNAKGFRSVVG